MTFNWCSFQSLIWVACPTGTPIEYQSPFDRSFNPSYGLHALRAIFQPLSKCKISVSIPHMGCMPYGHGAGGCAGRRKPVSIPHMGCMPYGRCAPRALPSTAQGFNPSYGLHALRANMMPIRIRNKSTFQSLIWVACPTGYPARGRAARQNQFQSLIWVACPTG